MLSGNDRANLDVAEFDAVGMVLEADGAFLEGGEFGAGFEFAFGEALFPIFAADLVFDDFFAIHPMLGVRAFDEEAEFVPLAGGSGEVFAWRVEIVTSAGKLLWIARAMGSVVEELDFGGVMPGGDRFFGDAVENAAVAVRDEFPFERQFEVLELLGGDDVIAAASAFAADAALHAHEDAVRNHPTWRHRLHFVAAPACGGLAVEEQFPASFLLGGRESVRFGGFGSSCSSKEKQSEE